MTYSALFPYSKRSRGFLEGSPRVPLSIMTKFGMGTDIYHRFHAWQSGILFAIVFVIHLIFSWSTVLSWLIFIGDLALIAFLTLRAYRDADTLDRYARQSRRCWYE
jgi:hypothetical protein